MLKECANKCYHSFGREKKAFIWGHTDKPLYAKGFCKQCYLARYKQKINESKLASFKHSNYSGKNKNINEAILAHNRNGFDTSFTEGDLYFNQQTSFERV